MLRILADSDKGNPKETVSCPSVDQVGYYRPVYTDRICDGRLDCHNGEDENGTLAKCKPEALLLAGLGGCCASYIVKGHLIGEVEYKYKMSSYVLAYGNWVNPNNSSQMIFRYDNPGSPLKGTWVHSVNGEMGEDKTTLLYSASSNEVNTACPPTDTTWKDTSGNQFSVVCKSSGPEFIDIKKCQDAKCDPVASCTDTALGFVCKCPSTHYGNGITCNEIIIEDECSNGNHNCPQVCHDKIIGYTCSCRDDQIDINGDGLVCVDIGAKKCCETFRIGVDGRNDIKLMCSYQRINSYTGMMDYTCEPDREFAAYKPLIPLPAAVQYIQHQNTPGYYLTAGIGLLAEGDIQTRPTFVTKSTSNISWCPSTISSDWEIASGFSWSLQCLDYTYINPEWQIDYDECTSGTNNCDFNAICTNVQGGFYCTCMAGFTGDGINCKPLGPFSFS